MHRISKVSEKPSKLSIFKAKYTSQIEWESQEREKLTKEAAALGINLKAEFPKMEDACELKAKHYLAIEYKDAITENGKAFLQKNSENPLLLALGPNLQDLCKINPAINLGYLDITYNYLTLLAANPRYKKQCKKTETNCALQEFIVSLISKKINNDLYNSGFSYYELEPWGNFSAEYSRIIISDRAPIKIKQQKNFFIKQNMQEVAKIIEKCFLDLLFCDRELFNKRLEWFMNELSEESKEDSSVSEENQLTYKKRQ